MCSTVSLRVLLNSPLFSNIEATARYRLLPELVHNQGLLLTCWSSVGSKTQVKHPLVLVG